jgi:transitional endoplasmic reticulum ATPase
MQEKEQVNVQIAQRHGKGFAAIGGCNELKELMNRNLVSILKNQKLAKQLGVAPPNVTLMYGPPGVGKTYVAERVAEEAGTNFCLVTPSTLASSYIHGSQQLIADLFRKLEKQSPVILAIDECDSLLPSRETDFSHHQAGEVNELLTQLNNCADRGIYVLMMTNYPTRLDYGALRRGRIDSLVYVGLPDEQTRKEIFQLELKDRVHEEDINYDALSQLSQNFTSSDVSYCAKEAARRCFYDSIKKGLPQAQPISQAVLEEVIRQTHPSVSEEQLRSYEQMREKIENLTPQRKRIGFMPPTKP